MRIDIITVLPELLVSPFSASIMKRAQDKGLAEIHVHDLRDFGKGRCGSFLRRTGLTGQDLEFASMMVIKLNMILITSPELADFRRRLKNLETKVCSYGRMS